ncbi:MAG: 2-oxoglutarate dehydrogenase E1 component, partial [Pseudomonadota bacterium]
MPATSMKQLFENSMLFGTNAPFIEELYEDYLQNPALVLPEWCSYFDELQKMAGKATRDVSHSPVLASFIRPATEHARDGQATVQGAAQAVAAERKQVSVLQIINAHR